MNLLQGSKVTILTNYGAEITGIVEHLKTFGVILQVEHKRRPVTIDYKDIVKVVKIY